MFALTWSGVRNGHETSLPTEAVIDLKLETVCAPQPSGKEWPFKLSQVQRHEAVTHACDSSNPLCSVLDGAV